MGCSLWASVTSLDPRNDPTRQISTFLPILQIGKLRLGKVRGQLCPLGHMVPELGFFLIQAQPDPRAHAPRQDLTDRLEGQVLPKCDQ